MAYSYRQGKEQHNFNTHNSNDSQSISMSSSRTMQDKRSMKIQFLESENKNLVQMAEDLQQSLKINKGIIRSLVD